MKLKQTIAMLGLLFPLTGARAQEGLRLIVGTYTDGTSEGIYSYRFDEHAGTAEVLDSVKVDNPSYLTVSKDGRRIYAVSERNDTAAAVCAIAFDERTGRMRLINRQPTHGEDPCYVEANDKMVLTANYSGGSVSVFPLDGKGALLPMTQQVKGRIGGPDSERQATPHVHCVRFAPDGKRVFATDFSADRVLQMEIGEDGKSVGRATGLVGVARDSGPRHIEYSGDGRFMYVMSELSGNVTVFDLKAKGKKMVQEIRSDDVNARGGADIHLSPDGGFLYSSNRLKNDGIAIFKVNAETGMLTRIGYQNTAMHPRNFNITPNGRFLLCACRDSDVIQVFEVDGSTGLLRDTGQDIRVSKPVCVKFY